MRYDFSTLNRFDKLSFFPNHEWLKILKQFLTCYNTTYNDDVLKPTLLVMIKGRYEEHYFPNFWAYPLFIE